MVSLKAKHRNEEKVWQIISGRSGILTGMMFRTRPLKFPRFTICHAYLFRSAHTKEVVLCSYSKEGSPLPCRVFCSRDNYMLLILDFDHKTMFTWPVLRWIVT